jgi:hypothetical protein
MNAVSPLTYTNEAPPELLASLDRSPHEEQPLAGTYERPSVVEQRQNNAGAQRPIAIYRLATEGSHTRDGGVIQQATTAWEITLKTGQQVRVAQVGDIAVSADGRTAHIVTGAGQDYGHLALVGSRLSNHDEIIDTPQATALFVAHEGVPMPDDFLPAMED